MRVEEIAPLWYKEKKHYVKRSSISAYGLLMQNHIIPYFGKKEEITDDDIQQFILDKLEYGLSQRTVRDVLIVFKMILKFGAKKKLIEFKQWDVQYPANNISKEIHILTIDEHKRTMNIIKENLTFRNLGILIVLSSGVRIGEVCALKWSDIDLDAKVMNVNKTIQRIYVIENNIKRTELIVSSTKTSNSNRSIPMTKDLINIFKAFKKIVNQDCYVLTNEPKPTEPRTYRSYYKNFMESRGLPKIKFHALRHSFATRCIEKKADVKTVSVLLGHANISTTMNLYVHPNAEQKKATIDNVFKNM